MNQSFVKTLKLLCYKMLIIIAITLFTTTITSCKTTDQERQAKKIAKIEKEKKKQAEKEYQIRQKRHMDIQDKKTRKRIKGNKTKMMDQTSVKQRNFWQRLFPKRDKTCVKE